MTDPTPSSVQAINTAAQVIQAKDGPWYSRTEFWGTLTSSIVGLLPFLSPASLPLIKGIGLGISGLAPIIYGYGRSNVKVATAAGIMGAVGATLSQ